MTMGGKGAHLKTKVAATNAIPIVQASRRNRKPYPIGIFASGAALPMVPFLLAAASAAIRGSHVAVGRNASADGWRGRPAVILGGKLSAICRVAPRVLHLRAHARSSWLAPRGHFR